MLGDQQVENDLVAREQLPGLVVAADRVATSAAVASAILLTNRTCLMARSSGS